MKKAASQRRNRRFRTRPGRAASSFSRPALQHLHHFHVVRVGRIVVVPDLVILLWRLQDEGNVIAALVLHQPLEGLFPYAAVSNQNVAILVGTQLASAVVEMKEG